jgi:predicted nucleic acid-binding Zn ribbon protein
MYMADFRGADILMECYSEGNAYNPKREQVRELRMAGKECREISERMGIEEDQVAAYCSQLGLPVTGSCRTWRPTAEQESYLQHRDGIPPERKCPVCGCLLVQPQRGRRKRFCSKNCKDRFWNTRQADRREELGRKTECENCGRIFYAVKEKDAERRFCCRDCYFEYRYGKRR